MQPAHTHKRHLPVMVNPWPYQWVRVHSPSPSQPPIPSSSRTVLPQRAGPSQPPIQSSSHVVLSRPLFIPDESSPEDSDDSHPSTPPPIVSLPQLCDCLSEHCINQWQTTIQTEEHVLAASVPHMTGPNPDAIATVLIKILKSLAEETPLPSTDEELKVNVSHIENLYSLFISYPTFRA
jgi:hypothetical protein